MKIASLGYMTLEVTDLDYWRTTLPGLLGLQAVEGPGSGSVWVRVDERAWRVEVSRSVTNRLSVLGWEMATDDDLTAAEAELAALGHDPQRGSEELKSRRLVRELVSFTDPFGFRHELFTGHRVLPNSFAPARPVSGYVTGDQGLGHVVLNVPDFAAAHRFYTGRLGFRLSDTMAFQPPGAPAPMRLNFYHLNARHHTLAFGETPGSFGIHHLNLQVDSLDDVGIAYELCQRASVPMTMTLGRHTNDRMVSFYMVTPAGLAIEYGWGAIEIDDQWSTTSYEAPSSWGHHFVPDTPAGMLEPFERSTAIA